MGSEKMQADSGYGEDDIQMMWPFNVSDLANKLLNQAKAANEERKVKATEDRQRQNRGCFWK